MAENPKISIRTDASADPKGIAAEILKHERTRGLASGGIVRGPIRQNVTPQHAQAQPFRPRDWLAAMCLVALASAGMGVAITKLADQPAPEIYLVDPTGQPVTAGSTSVPVPAEITP